MATIVQSGATITGSWTTVAPLGPYNSVGPASSLPLTGAIGGGVVTFSTGTTSVSGSWDGTALTVQLPGSVASGTDPSSLQPMRLTRGTAADLSAATALLGELNYDLKTGTTTASMQVAVGPTVMQVVLAEAPVGVLIQGLMNAVQDDGLWAERDGGATGLPVQVLDDAAGDKVTIYGAATPNDLLTQLASFPGLQPDAVALQKEITPTNAQTEVFADCVTASYRPTSYVLTCADGYTTMESVTYASWTNDSATGSGTLVANTCVPNCAASKKYTKTPVTFTLTAPAVVHGLRIFTRLVLHQPGIADQEFDPPTGSP